MCESTDEFDAAAYRLETQLDAAEARTERLQTRVYELEATLQGVLRSVHSIIEDTEQTEVREDALQIKREVKRVMSG